MCVAFVVKRKWHERVLVTGGADLESVGVVF